MLQPAGLRGTAGHPEPRPQRTKLDQEGRLGGHGARSSMQHADNASSPAEAEGESPAFMRTGMRPYLSGEDDFSELTDISSSVFCLISGKIRKRSPPTPPALAVRRSRFPAPFCPPEARDAALCEAAQPRSEGRARAHDRARRAEPSPSGGRRSSPSPRGHGGGRATAAAAGGDAGGARRGEKRRNKGFPSRMVFPSTLLRGTAHPRKPPDQKP